ncbi:Protein FAM91A1 [Blattella germanica]|nr:Protein FAM91A1 [Blattella germanica]
MGETTRKCQTGLRLLGIGRNEYIELMNQCRSGRKLFRRKNVKDLLPPKPADVNVEPWWNVEVGLKKKGLIYLDVPIEDDNYIVLPPLEGFVMNRVLGDYFETLLYKIFVSIDEHTSVGEVRFARKKNHDTEYADLNPTWKNVLTPAKINKAMTSAEETLLMELNSALADAGLTPPEETSSGTEEVESAFLSSQPRSRRIAFLFDSTLTAFLMMGNLSPGLKNHAVTMFEVGKLSDESLDSFLAELEKISTDDSEGEAQRYFDHALILRSTILFLRHNRSMGEELNLALDLIRCESLQLLVSMAPLSKEIRPISSCMPPHLGPAVPEVNTVWFKLFIYHLTGYGPPSLLLSKAVRKLSEHIDLSHNCGFITMVNLNTNRSSGSNIVGLAAEDLTPSTRPSETQVSLVEAWVAANNSPSTRTSNSPVNGFTSEECADILEQELDNLSGERSPNTKRPQQMHGKISGCAGSDLGARDSKTNLGNNRNLEDEWTLLDCCFGVPLFDAVTNSEICDAIVSMELWRKESLEKLTASSRRLCLRLLDFIAHHQDLPVLPEESSATSNKRATSPSVALPTRCLKFSDGKLQHWDGK